MAGICDHRDITLGHSPTQPDVFRSTAAFCEGRVAEDSLHALFHRECFALYADEMFADLFTDVGRRSVPPMIVAVVMVLRRLEGLSDREAVERFSRSQGSSRASGASAQQTFGSSNCTYLPSPFMAKPRRSA